MSLAAARALAQAGLLLAAGALVWPPAGRVAWLGSLPLALLAATGVRPRPRWGAWVAIWMIPYLSAAIMNLLAGPLPPARALTLSCGVALAGLAGLDCLRRSGISLRG